MMSSDYSELLMIVESLAKKPANSAGPLEQVTTGTFLLRLFS